MVSWGFRSHYADTFEGCNTNYKVELYVSGTIDLEDGMTKTEASKAIKQMLDDAGIRMANNTLRVKRDGFER